MALFHHISQFILYGHPVERIVYSVPFLMVKMFNPYKFQTRHRNLSAMLACGHNGTILINQITTDIELAFVPFLRSTYT